MALALALGVVTMVRVGMRSCRESNNIYHDQDKFYDRFTVVSVRDIRYESVRTRHQDYELRL